MNKATFAHQERTSAGIFYAAAFINSLASGITGPLLIIYLLFLHLTPAQVGFLLAVERLTMIVFEFPTGMFADRYGRKKSLLVSFALLGLSLIGWYLSTTFLQIFILAILGGVAYTFQSGAKESLMIDVLGLTNDDKLRNRTFVRVGSWGNAGFVAGGILAAILSFFALRSIWLAAAICNGALFLLFALLVREQALSASKNAGAKSPFPLTALHWQQTIILHGKNILTAGQEAIRSILNSKPLLLLLGVMSLFFLTTSLYGLAYPIYFKQTLHWPNYLFGLLGSISALVGILGMLLCEKISVRRGSVFVLRMFALLLALALGALGLIKISGVALFLFIIIEMLLYGWHPIYQSFFNKFVPNAVRASVLSLQSIIGLLIIALGELTTGALMAFLTPTAIIQYGSLLALMTVLLLSKKWPCLKQDI